LQTEVVLPKDGNYSSGTEANEVAHNWSQVMEQPYSWILLPPQTTCRADTS
jgi:hypothetical protein